MSTLQMGKQRHERQSDVPRLSSSAVDSFTRLLTEPVPAPAVLSLLLSRPPVHHLRPLTHSYSLLRSVPRDLGMPLAPGDTRSYSEKE